MQLPKVVYEALPVAYVLGGVTTTFSSHTVMAYVSGILLAAGGLIILVLRRNHRRQLHRRHTSYRRTLAGDTLSA